MKSRNKKPEKRNIFWILNDFNRIFGRTPMSIKLFMVDEEHAYFKMMYQSNVHIAPNGIEGDWNQYGNDGCNSAMVKVWITRNEKTQKPEFILWNDNFYINPYVMPDKNMADEFRKAVAKFSNNSPAVYMSSYRSVEFSKYGISTMIEFVNKSIKNLKQQIARESNLYELQSEIKKLDTTINTLKILQEEMDSKLEKLCIKKG